MIRAAIPLAALVAAPAAAQTQAAMTAQAGSEARDADAQLNAQWRRTYAYMKGRDAAGGGPGYAPALLASQRAWLAFRDAECRIEGYAFAGGSAEGMARAQCYAGLTRGRTVRLHKLMWPQ